jgi:hypothetical protein
MEYAREAGITLIPIPFWWDRSSSSLAATIQLCRPDVISAIPENALPIPKAIPETQNYSYKYNVPQEYDEQAVNPSGW